MIEILNKNGEVVNINDQFTIWYEDPQSININYVQKIYFISDQSEIDISIEKNEYFKLIDIQGVEYENIHIKGFKYNEIFIFETYIKHNSSDIGQFSSKIKIGNLEFMIGGDFYDQDETLKILLENNRINIPDEFIKAIPSINIREDLINNITLNNKRKELLLNYFNIFGLKGTYKSLEDSLSFFGWGEDVKLYEFWQNKNNTFKQRSLLRKKFDKDFKLLNESKTKTSFIGIIHGIKKYITDEYGIKFDNNFNPIIKNIESNLSINDISLKMTLLGIFYSTYFLPIHTNLIQSSIEDIIYGNNPRLVNLGSTIIKNDNIDAGYFSCSLDRVNEFFMDDNMSWVTESTIGGNLWRDGIEWEGLPILFVDNKMSGPIKSINNLKTFLNTIQNKYTSIVPIDIKLKYCNDNAQGLHIVIFNDKNELYKQFDFKKILNNEFNFNLLFSEPGNYKMIISIDLIGGKKIIRNFNITINIKKIDIDLYRIIPRDDIKSLLKQNNYINPELGSWYSGTKSNDNVNINMFKYADKKSIGITNIIYVTLNRNIKNISEKFYYYIKDNDGSYIKNDKEYSYDELKTKLTNDGYIFEEIIDGDFKILYIVSTFFINYTDKKQIFISVIDNKNKTIIHNNKYEYSILQFIPLFHKREYLIDDIYINDYELLQLSTSKFISDKKWIIENASNPKIPKIIIDETTEPFIETHLLSKGFYNITLTYSICNKKFNTTKKNIFIVN